LILRLESDHKEEIEERDQMIVKLQEVLAEAEQTNIRIG